MSTPARRPYNGSSRKLLIAFDVGTTFSGSSFAILDPDEVPQIQGVTRFPAQARTGGDCKIPSIIFYDQEGNIRGAGAEAMDEGFLEQADDENFLKVEWFKLHLRPRNMDTSAVNDSDLPPLPKNKSALGVFADFLKYLYDCTIRYIEQLGPLYTPGSEFWKSVENNIEFILSHPNGWEGPQQNLMRKAAVLAGLVNEESSQVQVQFVTEGEASLHFCVTKGQVNMPGDSLIVVDAGGGTVDLSAYYHSGHGSFEEIARTRCLLQGSVYVSRRAYAYLKEKLAKSKYSSEDDVKNIANLFDKTAKHVFRDSELPSFIRFGAARDRDPTVDIRNGQLKLAGNVVEEFFEPSMTETVRAIKEMQEESKRSISTVVLVGGFAANEWLFSNLKKELAAFGMTVSRPDGHLNKAVADGALSFYLDHFVSVRVAKYTYGVECRTHYNPKNLEHQRRSHTIIKNLAGRSVIPNSFNKILKKGTLIHEETEFSRHYTQEADLNRKNPFKNFTIDVLCYRGTANEPKWVDVEPHMYTKLCTIMADASSAAKLQDSSSSRHYTLNFSVVLLFGLTEFKAQVCWKENGQERRSPATIIYDETRLFHE